jgi:hypothetical protein
MAAARDNTAKRRADGRAKRRADAEASRQPTTESDGSRTEDGLDVTDALRGAASAAIAGAAVGAARALVHRRGREADDDAAAPQQVEPEPEAEVELEPEADESESPAGDSLQQPPEQEQERRPVQPPLSGEQARGIVERAREQLGELRGVEAESVSSVTRTADGWRIGLEVVELHRIPESTDVLATYVVELDKDWRLLTFERGERYVRSEAERR